MKLQQAWADLDRWGFQSSTEVLLHSPLMLMTALAAYAFTAHWLLRSTALLHYHRAAVATKMTVESLHQVHAIDE